MQKKLSNIIRKAVFFMIPIASTICYAGISDDVYASSETTEDSLIYNAKYREKYEKAEKKCQRIYCYISRKWDDVC